MAETQEEPKAAAEFMSAITPLIGGSVMDNHGSVFSIKPGDSVELTCGGWPMSVESATPYSAHCVWFDRDGQLHRDKFPLTCIQQCNPRATTET